MEVGTDRETGTGADSMAGMAFAIHSRVTYALQEGRGGEGRKERKAWLG